MQGYDLLMIAIIAGTMLFGAFKGMAWQLASLGSLVLSYFVSLYFSGPLVDSGLFGLSSPWNRFAAMFSVYSVAGAVVWFLFRQVSATIDKIKLRDFDRQLGALFGAFKGALLCTAVTFFVVTLVPQYRDNVMHSYSGQFIARKINEADAILPHEWHDELGPYIHRFEESFNLTPSHPDDHSHDHGVVNNPATTTTPGWSLFPNTQPASPTNQGRGVSGAQQPNTYQPQYPNTQPQYPVSQPTYPNTQPNYPATQPTYPNAQPNYPNPQPAPGYRPQYDPNSYPQGNNQTPQNYQTPTYSQQQVTPNYNPPNYQPTYTPQPIYQPPVVQNGNPQYNQPYSAPQYSAGYPTQNYPAQNYPQPGYQTPAYGQSQPGYSQPIYSQPNYAPQPSYAPQPGYSQQPTVYPPTNAYNPNQQTGYVSAYPNAAYSNGQQQLNSYSGSNNAAQNSFLTPGINPSQPANYGQPNQLSNGYNPTSNSNQATQGPAQEPTFWNWIEMVNPAMKQLK